MTRQDPIVSLSLFRFAGPGARIWAFTQMLLARRGMAQVSGIGFWKLFGSGTGEGFTPVPNTAVYGIMATWPDAETARAAINAAPVYARYRARSAENWTLFLSTSSVRGAWSGQAPFTVEDGATHGALAALTRATIRPRILLKFWKRVPSISAAIGADPNVAFKIGLGEVPWLHQVTFSVWPDTETMANFARRDGPHARAIKAVREGQWFAEELYARFRIVGTEGSWNGGDPMRALNGPGEPISA
ncbi:MAG: spheroidene monooxygenase [Pseudomonadota bacterium]